MEKKRVLVGSPVYQKPSILSAFLASLKNLNKETILIDYMFVDDNSDEKSRKLLSDFQNEGSKVIILPGDEQGEYVCNDDTHYWDDSLMLKVAIYKNRIIDYAIKENYDYLFFVDSDLILYPNLIEHLKTQNKDIISEIFWTKWHKGKPLEPNVWLFDEYDLVPKRLGEKLTEQEKEIRTAQFLESLKIPGVYEVGGLGASTLITRKALLAGVNFEPIKNLTIPGEDRFFCVRAVVLGFDLFVDTYYPAYHIYREKYLDGVKNYIKRYEKIITEPCQIKEQHRNKLTLSMVVKNEEKRYLKRVLNSVKGHIDEAVIIDDASTDNTVQICREILQGIPLHIIQNPRSMFANEVELRKKQWSETIKTNPDWILNIDADEIFEEGFWDNIQDIINKTDIDVYSFRLYDMWDEKHYREDKYWNAHSIYRPFLLRYRPQFDYIWNEKAQHCGRFPANMGTLKSATSEFRVQHFGWATPEDRTEKYKRYQLLDPDATYGIKEQYDSILDKDPNLIKWEVGEVT